MSYELLEQTCPMSRNGPFRTEMCTILFRMVHCGMWDRCIVGFRNLVYCLYFYTGISMSLSPASFFIDPQGETTKTVLHHCCICKFKVWSKFYLSLCSAVLTHWGRVTHICVGKLTIIGSDNGLSPCRRQAVIWTNAGILLIRPLGKKSVKS